MQNNGPDASKMCRSRHRQGLPRCCRVKEAKGTRQLDGMQSPGFGLGREEKDIAEAADET